MSGQPTRLTHPRLQLAAEVVAAEVAAEVAAAIVAVVVGEAAVVVVGRSRASVSRSQMERRVL